MSFSAASMPISENLEPSWTNGSRLPTNRDRISHISSSPLAANTLAAAVLRRLLALSCLFIISASLFHGSVIGSHLTPNCGPVLTPHRRMHIAGQHPECLALQPVTARSARAACASVVGGQGDVAEGAVAPSATSARA